MKLNIQNVKLSITAGLSSQFPSGSMPQIVFSGRSNVGKSSLINTLLNRKSLARVSSTPGKTITVNFYDIDRKIYFVDIPGYGYAKRAPQDKKKWSALTDSFICSDCSKRMFFQLIDMKIGPTEDDYTMLDWLDSTKSCYCIIATKCDKLNKTDFNYALNELNKLRAPVIPFSALTKSGKDDIWKRIFEFLY